jgi:hypothetical protein
LHTIPQGPPSPPASAPSPPPSRLHVACPCVEAGAAHKFPQLPQFAGCVRSTHAPEQLVGVELSASHPTVHAPLVHVAAPAPASGPVQSLVQLPHVWGSVGLTHAPLHSSVVGATHPASPTPPSPPSFFPPSPTLPSPPSATIPTIMTTSAPASGAPLSSGACGAENCDPQRQSTKVAAAPKGKTPRDRFIVIGADNYTSADGGEEERGAAHPPSVLGPAGLRAGGPSQIAGSAGSGRGTVTAGREGSHYQRHHRYPGTPPLTRRRFFALRSRGAGRAKGERARSLRSGMRILSGEVGRAVRVARCGSLSRGRSARRAR